MQNMKNATKQLNTPAWHRPPADKLSVTARRPSKIGAQVAYCRRRRRQFGCGADGAV